MLRLPGSIKIAGWLVDGSRCGGGGGSSVREGKGGAWWVIEIRLGDVDASTGMWMHLQGRVVLGRWKAALRG